MGRSRLPLDPQRLAAALEDFRCVQRQAAELGDELRANGVGVEPISSDHPLVKAAGLEEKIAALLSRKPAVDRCPSGLSRQDRSERAAERRGQVLAMSLANRSVAEIAEALGLHYCYVVQLRAQLGVGRVRGK